MAFTALDTSGFIVGNKFRLCECGCISGGSVAHFDGHGAGVAELVNPRQKSGGDVRESGVNVRERVVMMSERVVMTPERIMGMSGKSGYYRECRDRLETVPAP